MAKFHINKNGVPAPCHAKKGNCPLGGDSGNENHYESQEEAQNAVDLANEIKHGLLPVNSNEAYKSYPVDEIDGESFNNAITEWMESTPEGREYAENRTLNGVKIRDADIFRARVEQNAWQGYGADDEYGGPGLIEDGETYDKEVDKFEANEENIYNALEELDPEDYTSELSVIALSERARGQLEEAGVIDSAKDENTIILQSEDASSTFFSYNTESQVMKQIDEYETISSMKEDEYLFEDAFFYTEDTDDYGHDLDGLSSYIPEMENTWRNQITPIAQKNMYEKTK